ncbi:MAG: DUF4240 domain-containing protein, partial [Spirochaetota bacterium]
MDEAVLWQLIGQAKKEKKIDVDILVDDLAKRSVDDIYKFEEILTDKLYDLDGKEYAKTLGYHPDTYFSVDSFLYARVYVVECGKDFYYKVLTNLAIMPNTASESLLGISQLAYQKKTGKENWDY